MKTNVILATPVTTDTPAIATPMTIPELAVYEPKVKVDNCICRRCRDQEIERDIRRVVIIVEIAFCVTFNVIAMVNLLNTADILDMFDDISAMFVDDEYSHFSEEFARGAIIASTIYAFGIVASLVVIFGAIIFKAPLIGLASVWTVAQIVARTVLQARYYR